MTKSKKAQEINFDSSQAGYFFSYVLWPRVWIEFSGRGQFTEATALTGGSQTKTTAFFTGERQPEASR
jgi:hypothetical protein